MWKSMKRGAQKLKLKAKIDSLRREVHELKRKMGLDIYDLYDEGKEEEARQSFNETKSRIMEINEMIEIKRAEIAALGAEAGTVSNDAQQVPKKRESATSDDSSPSAPPEETQEEASSNGVTLEEAKSGMEFYQQNQAGVDKAIRLAKENPEEAKAVAKFALKNKDSLIKGAKLAGKLAK